MPVADPSLSCRPRRAGGAHRRRTGVGLLALLLLLPVLSGCLRVQMTMGVSKSDLVSGHLVVATVPEDGNDEGPQLTPPKALENKMRVEPYRQDGFVGSDVYFTDLTFSEVRGIGGLSPEHSTDFSLNFGRSGDLVSFNGRADLSAVPDGSDIELRINFPVRPSSTDGLRNSSTGVSWRLAPGEVTTMYAQVSYPDPDTRGLGTWIALVTVLAVLAAGVIGLLAWRSRDTSPVP